VDDTRLVDDAVVGILENRSRRCERQLRNKAGPGALSCIVYWIESGTSRAISATVVPNVRVRQATSSSCDPYKACDVLGVQQEKERTIVRVAISLKDVLLSDMWDHFWFMTVDSQDMGSMCRTL